MLSQLYKLNIIQLELTMHDVMNYFRSIPRLFHCLSILSELISSLRT